MDIARNPGPDDTMNNYGSLDLPRKALNICHYNVCSLGNKLDEIKLLLSSSSKCANNRPNFILGLSETHLNDSWTDASLQVKGFTTFRRDRVGGKGGGLLVYVPSHLPITRNTYLEVIGLESVSLQLQFKNSKPCLFTFVYRPPSANASYYDLMDSLLTLIDCTKYQSVILGDFNINLLDNSVSNTRFIQLFKSLNYEQLITVATRPISNSLLDHIYSNRKGNILKSGTLSLSLSDHLPIFISTTSLLHIILKFSFY